MSGARKEEAISIYLTLVPSPHHQDGTWPAMSMGHDGPFPRQGVVQGPYPTAVTLLLLYRHSPQRQLVVRTG